MGFLTGLILLFIPFLQNKNKNFRFKEFYGQEYDFITTQDNLKQRLDVYLSSSFEQYSRSFLSNLCDQGKVIVNGKIEGKSYKMGKMDNVHVDIDVKIDDSVVAPEYIPLDILYEDEHIIAINKPNGMVVHPAPGSPNGTFVNALLYHLGMYKINGYGWMDGFFSLILNSLYSFYFVFCPACIYFLLFYFYFYHNLFYYYFFHFIIFLLFCSIILSPRS